MFLKKIDTGFPMGFPLRNSPWFPVKFSPTPMTIAMPPPQRWAMGCGHHWCPWRCDERPGRRGCGRRWSLFLALKKPWGFADFYRMLLGYFRGFLGVGISPEPFRTFSDRSGFRWIFSDCSGVPRFFFRRCFGNDGFTKRISEFHLFPAFPGFFFSGFLSEFSRFTNFFPYFAGFSKLFPEFRRCFPDFRVFFFDFAVRLPDLTACSVQVFRSLSVDLLGFSKDIWYHWLDPKWPRDTH